MNTDSILTAITVKGIDIAYNEIKKLLGKSKEIAHEKALNEQADLLRILNEKIKKLDKTTQDLLYKNLEEPDAHESVKKAFNGVYKYSDPLKTELTAELVWQRLTSNLKNNVNNQIINEALVKLEKLSAIQLNILAAAYLLGLSEYNPEIRKPLKINNYKEWISGNLSQRYFLERNVLNIYEFTASFSYLDHIKLMDNDIYFIKSEGLADLNSFDTSSLLYESFNKINKKYSRIDKNLFLDFAKESLTEKISEEYNFKLTDNFFRLNLNSYGLYIAKATYKLLESRKQEIEKEREAKAKYNQAQYERYNAGLLSEG